MSRSAMTLAFALVIGGPMTSAANEPTIVIGRKAPGTASTRRADATELAQVPAKTAEDFLQLVPGLHVVQHGSEGKGHQFFVRGFDAVHGSDVRVSVEGVPLNEPSNIHGHGYVDLAFVIPELVLAVDAHKGAYDLEQGDFGTAGVIDFKLGVSERDQGLRTAYQIGTTNRHRGVAIYAPDAVNFIALEGLSDAGFGQTRSASRGTIMARWMPLTASKNRLSIWASGYSARFGLPGALRAEDVASGERDFYDAYLDDTAGASDRVLLAVNHSGRSGKLRLKSHAFAQWRRLRLDENFTGYLQVPVEGDRHIQSHAFIEGGVGSKLAIRLARSLTLRAHLGWRGGALTQREDLVDDAGRVFDIRRQLDASQHAAHTALGVTWRPITGLRVEAGGRFDAFAASGTDGLTDESFSGVATAISPRVQLVASPTLDWEIFAAYGRGLRSPEARAFSTAGADVTVADNAEVGVRFTPSDAFSVGLATFWVGIERETIFDHAAAVTVQQGATRRLGGEIDVRWDPLNWLRLDADLAVARARFVNPADSLSGEAEVPNAPRLLATLGSTVTHPTGWEASLHVLWLGARPLAFGATAGDAVMVDTGVGYRWSAVRLRLDVENPLNRQIREGEAQFASRWDRDQPGGQLPAIHYFAAAPINARFTVTGWF